MQMNFARRECVWPQVFYRSSFSLPILSEINEELQKVLGRVSCVGCDRRYSIAVHFLFSFYLKYMKSSKKLWEEGTVLVVAAASAGIRAATSQKL